jgi:hypothetical protein
MNAGPGSTIMAMPMNNTTPPAMAMTARRSQRQRKRKAPMGPAQLPRNIW